MHFVVSKIIYNKEVKHHIVPPTEKDESKRYIIPDVIEISIEGNNILLRYAKKTVRKVRHAKTVILQESLRYSDANRLDSLRLLATVDKEIPSTKIGNDTVKLKLTHVSKVDSSIMPNSHNRASVIAMAKRMVIYVLNLGLNSLPMSIIKNFLPFLIFVASE